MLAALFCICKRIVIYPVVNLTVEKWVMLVFFFASSPSMLLHSSLTFARCPISMIFLNDLKEKFQHRMSTRYVALKLSGKRKKLEGKEGKDRRGVKAQQQLPRTIINHQERDNRIVQPTGEQLSLRWALSPYTLHVATAVSDRNKKKKEKQYKRHCRKSIAYINNVIIVHFKYKQKFTFDYIRETNTGM